MQQKNTKKRLLLFCIFLFFSTVLLVIIVSFFRNKSSNPEIVNKLASTSLGSGASVDLPINFVTTDDNSGALVSLEEPGTQAPKEKLVIQKYTGSTPTMDDLKRNLTTNSKGTIKGIKVKTEKTKSGNNYLVISKDGKDTTKSTESYYLYFGDKIWEISFIYNPGSFLDKSKLRIVESFNPGGY